MESIQDIVDDLARGLRRSVAVDDEQLQLLAASAHFDDADPARVEALVGRVVSVERAAWARAQGVFSAMDPMHLEGSEPLGIHPRYAVPIRVHRELVALLWMIEKPPLTADEIDAVTEAVDRIRLVLARRARAREDQTAQIKALALTLLSDLASDRGEAALEIASQGYFANASSFRIALITAANGLTFLANDLVSVDRGAAAALSTAERNTWITADVNGLLICILGSRLPLSTERQRQISSAMQRETSRLLGPSGKEATVSMGGSLESMSDVWKSYEQATIAHTVGRVTERDISLWDEAGPLEYVAAITAGTVPDYLGPARYAELLQAESADTLDVLRSYLRHGGNVTRMHDELGVHRTTIYYRMDRFHERTGLDLADGDTRFMMQLALHLAQLAGNAGD